MNPEDAAAGGSSGSALPSIPDIFGSVVNLVAAGGNGLAAIIFVSMMIVIVFSIILGSRLSKDMVGLSKWYLVVGAVCVLLSLISSFVDRFFGATYDVHVSVSPSLASASLPPPVIKADTLQVQLDERFKVNDNIVINVGIDDILNAVRARDQAVVATIEQANTQNATLAEENTKLAQTLAEQSLQLETVRASYETIKAGLETTPVWADMQVDQLGQAIDSVQVIEPADYTVPRFDPITISDDLIFIKPGIID